MGDSGEDIKTLFQLGQVNALTALNSKAGFKGTFDGQGHTISGAFADCQPNAGYQSMFGGLGDNGVIKNLKITNSYFNGSETADKIAGAILVSRAMGTNMLISNVTIENVLLDEGAAAFSGVGILVAKLDEGSSLTIENCHTAGTISFPTKGTNGSGFGGIIGAVESGLAATDTDPAKITTLVLKNCTSSAVIDALEFCGGLVGTIGDRCSVTMDYKCKFTGTINTCPDDKKGTYVGNNADFVPEQLTIVDKFTELSPFMYPEFNGAITLDAASSETGSLVFNVTEAGTYTFGSYISLEDNADRACLIQINGQAPILLQYTLGGDGSALKDADGGSYLKWVGVEVELEAGEHTLTFAAPDEDILPSTASWLLKTIYVVKKAA